MELLVIGGGIFLGASLVDAALTRGHRLTVFNRGRSRTDWPGDVEVLIGDRSSDLGLLAARRFDAVIDTCAYVFFFLPAMGILCVSSWDDFLYSMDINEKSNSGAWAPILWPLRGVIPLTAFMLFLQGISELMKSLWAWRTGEFLTKHEKIEV